MGVRETRKKMGEGSFLDVMTLADWLFVGLMDAFAFLYFFHLGRESREEVVELTPIPPRDTPKT